MSQKRHFGCTQANFDSLDQDITHRKPNTMYLSMTSTRPYSNARHTSGSNISLTGTGATFTDKPPSTFCGHLNLGRFINYMPASSTMGLCRQRKLKVPGDIPPTSVPTFCRLPRTIGRLDLSIKDLRCLAI